MLLRQILKPSNSALLLPMVEGIKAGFPSPAQDFLESSIDLNNYLIKHPSSTFFAYADGNSLIGAGIKDKDLLIIDKSVRPKSGDIAVCIINGEFTLKRLYIKSKQEIYLMPENPKYKPIRITESDEFVVWGVLIYSVQKHL